MKKIMLRNKEGCGGVDGSPAIVPDRFELRVADVDIEADESKIKVSGYAAVFDEETNIGGYFREVFKKGAFKEAVKRDDVVFLVNHGGLPLARTLSGTLTLREDAKGLFMETELDATDPDVMQIVPKMQRGDMDKMSFAFNPTKQEWDETEELALRTIFEAELFDVSIVTHPAYQGTEIGLRAFENHKKEIKTNNFNATQRRKKLKRHLDSKRIAKI